MHLDPDEGVLAFVGVVDLYSEAIGCSHETGLMARRI
jgi:hypothetical protein